MNSLSPLRCPHGCKPVKQGFKLVRRYGPHYTPLYECLRCGQQFSGRYDSVFSGFHTDEQTIYRVLKALSEGIGIRAAARIFDLDKKTVGLILERAAEHCKRVSEQLIKNYHLDECQLDELLPGIGDRSDGHVHFFPSDELKHYDAAIMHAYGTKKDFPKAGPPGRQR